MSNTEIYVIVAVDQYNFNPHYISAVLDINEANNHIKNFNLLQEWYSSLVDELFNKIKFFKRPKYPKFNFWVSKKQRNITLRNFDKECEKLDKEIESITILFWKNKIVNLPDNLKFYHDTFEKNVFPVFGARSIFKCCYVILPVPLWHYLS